MCTRGSINSQVERITSEFSSKGGKPLPVVISGDFNSVPGSSPYTLIASGFLQRESLKEADPEGIISLLPLEHRLQLKSVRGRAPPRRTLHAPCC